MNKIETLQELLYSKEEIESMSGFQKEYAKIFNDHIKDAIGFQKEFEDCDSL